MKYLIDTCILSELMKPVPDPRVLAWFDSVADSSLFVSLFSLGEVRRGILRLPASRRRDELARILDEQLIPLFSAKFVAWNRMSAEIWAKIYAQCESSGRCPALIDSMIAATALSHGMTMVTRNVSDFQFEGLQVVNPFEFL